MNRYRTLIVEDEPLARRSLRELVAAVSWLEVVGEAADGRTAAERIDAMRPDLVFLDVHLPELSGVDALEQATHKPAVVFTTAYDRYAVTAFELGAVDYLVKPFGRKRFMATMERVRERLERDAADPPLETRIALAKGGAVRRLFARKGEVIEPIAVDRIVRIEACDDYCTIHADGKQHLLTVGLSELAERLDGERFLRVHRSHIVNLDFVDRMAPAEGRRISILMDDGSEVVASRAGSQKLREMIG